MQNPNDNQQSAVMLRFFVIMTAFMIFWYYFYPKPKPKPEESESQAMPSVSREQAAAVGTSAILGGKPFQDLTAGLPSKVEAPKMVAASTPAEPHSLIALGDDGFALKILLTNKGAGVQQLVLTRFKESNRLGLPAKDEAGQTRKLHLIPGFLRPQYLYMVEKDLPEHDYPQFQPNVTAESFAKGEKPKPVTHAELLSSPSYAMLHYPSKDDPAIYQHVGKDGKLKPDAEKYPLPTLADSYWKVVSIQQPADGPWEVVFETQLAAPYHLKIRRTYSLAKTDYDFKTKVEILPLPERLKGSGKFRYQISGPIGTPIEGEWYTTQFRTLYMGWLDGRGDPHREIDDPASIHYRNGGDSIVNPRFNYAAISTQYFASALVVDDDVSATESPWEYIRGTRETQSLAPETPGKQRQPYDSDRHFLFDITFRAVSRVFDPGAGEQLVHNYVSYNGPVKVQQLEQLRGTDAVASESMERYLSKYHLQTMTDYHSPNWFGRQFNAIGWTWLLIKSTNFMHWLLGSLHSVVGNWGVSIMLLTVIVRLCLFIPSRRQQAINAHMSAQITALKPQIDKLNEQYKDDFMALSQAKRELFREAGINQFAQMGGCLLLFLQMPILMGLYFCLQESVFFRLEPFLWIQNLSAPDMLGWWSENVPVISTPWSRFGGFNFLYLGPYFNILPLAAVVLFYVQQKLTMPPPTDDIQAQQQAMMKYMLVFTGLFFYKVAAGLCVYFIVSGLWSLLERRLIPKPDLSKAEAIAKTRASESAATLTATEASPTTEANPSGGGFWAKMKQRIEDAQRESENTRQIRNSSDAPADNGNGAGTPKPSAAERAEKRKKKKKGK